MLTTVKVGNKKQIFAKFIYSVASDINFLADFGRRDSECEISYKLMAILCVLNKKKVIEEKFKLYLNYKHNTIKYNIKLIIP